MGISHCDFGFTIYDFGFVWISEVGMPIFHCCLSFNGVQEGFAVSECF